ncbi:MAG: hypothetical protein IT328_20120 [Caldilineaceae bacterium]|nr:hypothetical protein [Caldilineaceae bacterium]
MQSKMQGSMKSMVRGVAAIPTIALVAILLFVLLLTQGQSAEAQSEDTNFTSVRVEHDLRLKPAPAVTLTNGATLTPTGSYQPVTAAGAVGFGAIVADAPGTLLLLTNVSANTITVSDTGTLKLGGNRALGQYDTLWLVSDGTNWLELGYVNN